MKIAAKSRRILDTSIHSEVVNRFIKYFSLPEMSSGLQRLQETLSCFAQFPYENLSKIIKHHQYTEPLQKLRLPDEVMEDHIQKHLGGTCFSLTYFLQTILTHQGFACYSVMADMRWGKNVHCALIVIHDKRKYLVDPGYMFNQPMEINTDKPRWYRTEFSGIELIFQPENAYHLYTFDRNQTKWRYCFQDQPVSAEIFLEHWLDSFYWNSMHGLCLNRVEKDKMIYVHKTFMRETTFDQKKNRNIKKNYHAVIQTFFGIDPTFVEEAQAALTDNMRLERERGLWIPKNKDSR